MRGYRGHAGWGWGFGYRNRGRWCPWRDWREFLRGVEEVVVSDADPRLVDQLEAMGIKVTRRSGGSHGGEQA